MSFEPSFNVLQRSQLESQASSGWILERIKPYIKGTLMEIASGTGILSSLLIESGISNIILTDPIKSNRDKLRAKFKGVSAVKYVENIDLEKDNFEEFYTPISGTIDTIAALNVAENGFFNNSSLNNAKFLLRPRGHLFAILPSKTVLFPNSELNSNELRRHFKHSDFIWLENSQILKGSFFQLSGVALILVIIRKI